MPFRKMFGVRKEVKANVARGTVAWRSTVMDRTRHQSLTRNIDDHPILKTISRRGQQSLTRNTGSQTEGGTRGGPVVTTVDRTRQQSLKRNTGSQMEGGTRGPVVTTMDITRQQSLTGSTAAAWCLKKYKNLSFTIPDPTGITADPLEQQSVTRNTGGTDKVERGRRRSVGTTMDKTKQQSPTRNAGGTDKVEKGRSCSPVVSTSDGTIQQLEDKITSLQDEIKIKEAERKYYQDDRDKVCESWNTTKVELRMKEAELHMKDKMLEETKLAHSTEVKLKERLESEVQRKEQERQSEHDKVCESWNTTKEELRMKEAELKMKDKMLEEAKLAHLTEVKLKERLEREVQRKEQEQQCYQAEHDKVCESWNTTKEELRMKEAELKMKDKMLEEAKLAHLTEVKLKECLEREVRRKEQELQCYQAEHDKICESWNTTKEELRMKEAELKMKEKMLEETKLAHSTEVKLKECLEREVRRKEQELQCYQAEHDKICESWNTTKEELRMKEAELKMKEKMLEETKLAHSTEVKMKEHLQHEIEKKEEDRRYYQTERDKFYEYWKTAQEQLKIKEAELQMKDKMLEQIKLEHSAELELKGSFQREIEKKEEDRQYYQTERDKFYEHRKTTQEQLKAKEAQLQMKDKMLEETKVAHLIEVKSYEERLKNVMLEYGNYKNSHPEKHTGTAEIMEVDDDKCELTSCMNQMKAEREDFVAFLLSEHKKNLETKKQQYEETIEKLKNKQDEGHDTLKDMGETKKKEIQKIEETNNGRIENLAEYHDQACTDIQNQYGDINGSNWSTIATLKDENKELQRRERILQIKFDAVSRENEFLKGINSYYHGEVTIQKDAKSANRFGVNHLTQNKMNELNEEVKRLHQENDLLAEKLKIIESEKDAFHSNFKSLSQPAENRMITKATPAKQKGQTVQENLGMEPALRLPSLPHPSASHQPLELNEELTGMSGETGQLEITAQQSGPPTEMSQGTFRTDPPTHDAKEDSMPYYLRRRNRKKKLNL